VVETQPYFKAEISKLKDSKPKNKEEYEALLENVKDLALKSLSWIQYSECSEFCHQKHQQQ
jgi:hypothetical protein